jgi:phage terminase large subunit-like protein
VTVLATAQRTLATPRFHTPRSSRDTRGPQVDLVAQRKGKPLMPWQHDALEVALEVDPDTGENWFDTVLVTVQRQSGKTKLIGDVADHTCMTKRGARTWFTQQTGKHASTWMREEHFLALAEAAPLLGEEGTAACRYTLSRRAGTEGVAWKATGGTFYAFPPNRDAMHSKQSDKTFVDEAWAFDAEQGAELRQAIRATFNTRPGAQLWVVSAAGDANSAYLDEYLARARLLVNDPTSRICLVDYGLRDDEDPEDLDVILRRHPAYGYTITRQAIEAARVDFANDPGGWARAYANIPTKARDSLWPDNVWTECGEGLVPVPERYGVAFDVTPMGDTAAVAAAWRDHRHHAIGQLVETFVDGNLRELPELLIQLGSSRRAPIDYDPRSPGVLGVVDAVAKQLAEPENRRLRDLVELRAVPVANYAAACVQLSKAVFAREFHHGHQAELTEATQNATTSSAMDGGFCWARKKSTGSIAELVAVTLAVRAFDTLPAPRRKPVASAGRR